MSSGSGTKRMSWLQETLLLIVMALALALILKTFFVQAFYIPSGSMRATLQRDDRILVQKVSYWFSDVRRGDVVVFDDSYGWLPREDASQDQSALVTGLSAVGLYPSGGHLVKRVIGIGGDTVRCRDGDVVVNGQPLREARYVTVPRNGCRGSWGPVRVPADRLWVMGDNRNRSADSRSHLSQGTGFVPVDDVVGKVFVIVWPASRWEFLNRPATFETPALESAASPLGGLAPLGAGLLAAPLVYRRIRRSRRNRSRGDGGQGAGARPDLPDDTDGGDAHPGGDRA